MTIIERIIQYIDYKSITKYKFHKDLGFSNGFLDKNRSISSDNYAKILDYYPDINPDWLLTGNGQMLRSKGYDAPREEISVVNEPNEVYKTQNLNDKIKLQEETILFLRERILDLEAKLNNEVSEKKLLADIKKIN